MSDSRNFSGSRLFEIFLVGCLLTAISVTALSQFYRHGHLLYYGDAVAHLNIARRIVDSRTPGLDQIGTVWLPLPHLLTLPFVGNDFLWRNGLAGAIPAAACFVLAGGFLFAGIRRAAGSRAAAWAATGLFALNPNVLYLQSVPMTEVIFLACFFALMYFCLRFRDTQSLIWAGMAGAAAFAGTLTRYEGWFLLPFVAVFFLWTGKRNRIWAALLFGAVASLGPLFWLLHNRWFYGDPLEFYRGYWSAKAIYQRSLDSGMQPYPGDGNWREAWRYFGAAARLCAGWPAAVLGLVGVAAALWKRLYWPVVLLALPPVFYILSMHSSGTPVFVPHLWPESYYNTRYGLAALPLLILGAAALVLFVRRPYRRWAAIAVLAVAISPWLWKPSPESWICWKEAEVNSVTRRAWTEEAAKVLAANYRDGGIIAPFGDMTGVFPTAGIPLRETLHSGNAPMYQGSIARPDLFLREKWALAMSGDEVATAILRSRKDGPRYECVKMIALEGSPVIEIYRRVP